MYYYYQQARNAAWETLLACGIQSLPVNILEVAHHFGIHIAAYSRCALMQLMNPDAVSGDGFLAHVDGIPFVFVNDRKDNRARRRFTLGHEVGHFYLKHPVDVIHTRNNEVDSKTDVREMQANVFSRDLLMPAGVLAAIGATTPEQVMQLCDISRTSAEIRAQRLSILRDRNKFGTHPLERQVLLQFSEYIEEQKRKEV